MKVRWIGYEDAPPFRPLVTVESQCYHCNKTTRWPLRTLERSVDDMWRQRYEKLMGQLNDAVSLCTLKRGTTPMMEEMYKEFRDTLIDIREEEGEKWKRSTPKGDQ